MKCVLVTRCVRMASCEQCVDSLPQAFHRACFRCATCFKYLTAEANFSHDGKRLVLRSAFPKDAKQAEEDKTLLTQQVVRPSLMEICVCDRDGKNWKQLTKNGAANFAPFWTPDDQHIVFASNFQGVEEAKKSGDRSAARRFRIYMMDQNGENLQPVTNSDEFDSFPMFSPDGKHIVWASNRYNQKPGETNLFVADWVK